MLNTAACLHAPSTPAVPSVSGVNRASSWSPLGVVPAPLSFATAGPASTPGVGPHYSGQPLAHQGIAPGAAPLNSFQSPHPLNTPSASPGPGGGCGANLAPVSVAYVSPSAIETFDDAHGGCMRKWAWSKLDRLPKTEGAAAALGTAVHSQHEDWLRYGKPYDLTKREGEIAHATLHLLPAPGVANVEGETKFQLNGITYGGKLDGEWLEQAGWPRLASHPPEGLQDITPWSRAVVLDHKTGNKNYFKLAREQLLGHPQAPIYAARSFQKYQTPIVELRWNYATTTGKPKPFPSWHVVRPEDVHGVWAEQVERPAKRLLEVVSQANHERAQGRPFGALQLPPNYNACAAYGGCPFRSKCQLTGPQEIQAHMTQVSVQQQQQDFLQRIMPQGAAPAAAAPLPGLAAPVQAPPPMAPPPMQGPPAYGTPTHDPNYVHDGKGAYMFAPGGVIQTQPAAPVQTAPVAQTAPVPPMSQGYGPAINPPESQLPPAQVAAAQAELAPAVVEPAPKPAKTKAKKDETDVLGSVLAGLCSNPAAFQIPPEQIALHAKAIAAAVSA
jgi:hypothetical protein